MLAPDACSGLDAEVDNPEQSAGYRKVGRAKRFESIGLWISIVHLTGSILLGLVSGATDFIKVKEFRGLRGSCRWFALDYVHYMYFLFITSA